MPYESDRWISARLAEFIAYTNSIETARTFFRSILELGPAARYWVEEFLRSWTSSGIQVTEDLQGFAKIWQDMVAYTESLPAWQPPTREAKFWQQVLTELQNRGVKDIFIACVDGLKGFPEAIEAVYPRTEVQLCIVHLVRASLNYVPWKARKPVAADLQLIYRAGTVAEAEQHLAQLEGKWKAYPSVSQVWRRNWARIAPFFNYPPDIRKAIYTTNKCGIAEPVAAQDHQNPRRIPQPRGGAEVAVSLRFGKPRRSRPCRSIIGGKP